MATKKAQPMGSNNLFTPGNIGKLQIKNRIIMAPMGVSGLTELDGRYSQRAIDYYACRAKGGTGLIITGVLAVEVEIEKRAEAPWSRMPRADSLLYLARLNELADAVHVYGSKIAAQLTAGYGRNTPASFANAGWAVGPSPVPCFWAPNAVTRELSTLEVESLVRSFGVAAGVVKAAGFDAVELHGHEGYLMDMFMTSLWNKRRDKYGGNLQGRLTFVLEIIEHIRREAGQDFPIIFRFGATHHLEGGRTIEESCQIARHLQEAGVDAFDVDAGCYETWQWAHPPAYAPSGCHIDMADTIKEVVDVPVIAVGKLGHPPLAEKVLAEGEADFIALGRPLLTDPEWPRKVREGRLQDILPCIGCNDGCLVRVQEAKYLSCAVNPTLGMEREFAIHPALKQKRVLIVGGGPAGMEAARVAALRGHNVTLWEKSDKLGGNLIPAAFPTFKREIRGLTDYLSNQIRKLGVQIQFGKEGTPELVRQFNADAVIIATGAIPVIPDIPGAKSNKAVTAVDVLVGRKCTGENVVVVGGGIVGCETAAWLAEKGKKVTIVEMLDQLVPDMPLPNRKYLLENILSKSDVEVLTETKLLQITKAGAVIETRNGQRERKADTVVLAVGLNSQKGMLGGLEDKLDNVHAIGDCVEARKIINAIWEAFNVARLI